MRKRENLGKGRGFVLDYCGVKKEGIVLIAERNKRQVVFCFKKGRIVSRSINP